MNILIACEESQRVCISMRYHGYKAYSCDVQQCSGGYPEWHIQDDVLKILNGGFFRTCDNENHYVDHWDLIIAHPPCTYISNAGACRLYPHKGVIDQNRYEKGVKAKEFFMSILQCNCKYIAIENPIPSKIYEMPAYTQVLQPYEFGHPYSKKTCLWLKGLPKLIPTNILSEYKPYVSCGTSHNKGNKDKAGVSRAGGAAKVRSKTFWGIADAMADQWGKYVEEAIKNAP